MPLYSGLAAANVTIGHLVTSDQPHLRIQCTQVNTDASRRLWHVAVNNAENTTMTARLAVAVDIRGLRVDPGPHVLGPGEWRIVSVRA